MTKQLDQPTQSLKKHRKLTALTTALVLTLGVVTIGATNAEAYSLSNGNGRADTTVTCFQTSSGFGQIDVSIAAKPEAGFYKQGWAYSYDFYRWYNGRWNFEFRSATVTTYMYGIAVGGQSHFASANSTYAVVVTNWWLRSNGTWSKGYADNQPSYQFPRKVAWVDILQPSQFCYT